MLIVLTTPIAIVEERDLVGEFMVVIEIVKEVFEDKEGEEDDE